MGDGFVAHDVVSGLGRRLVAGHGSVLVLEDDVENVLAFFDAVGDGCHASPEESRITHQRVLFVRDERVHTATRGTA